MSRRDEKSHFTFSFSCGKRHFDCPFLTDSLFFYHPSGTKVIGTLAFEFIFECTLIIRVTKDGRVISFFVYNSDSSRNNTHVHALEHLMFLFKTIMERMFEICIKLLLVKISCEVNCFIIRPHI